jgi:DsbC/DsbD-like thiol-disulfide interchange protein
MKRRTLLASLIALPLSRVAFSAEPWKTELWDGGRQGDQFICLLHIALEDGWKTYWRVPGEAGIPPQIDVKGDNLAFYTVDYPLPQRIVDASGEAIGYHHDVAFIIRARAKDIAKPVTVEVSAFYGVCKDICRPAKFAVSANLGLDQKHATDVATWAALVPKLDRFVTEADIVNGHLVLKLAKPVDEIFVEGPEQLYFRKPEFDGATARFKIDGLKAHEKLMGVDLRLTATAQGMGLEQKVMLA